MKRLFLSCLSLGVLLSIGSLAFAKPPAPPSAEAGVAFSAALEQGIDLTNSYQDIQSVTIYCPHDGYVVLTGSGYFLAGTNTSNGWANVSIGPVSNGSNNGHETAVTSNGGYIPFSLTAVFPVTAGSHNFYMTGIRDPNTSFYGYAVDSPHLTAVYIRNGL